MFFCEFSSSCQYLEKLFTSVLSIIYQQGITSLNSSDCILKTLVFILILSLFPSEDIFSYHSGNFARHFLWGLQFLLCLLGSLLISSRKELGTPTLLICVCQSNLNSSSFIFLISTLRDSAFPVVWLPLRWLTSIS